MNSAEISPGRLTALWLLLSILKRTGGLTQEVLLSYAKRSSLRGGGLPIDDGYSLGIRGGLILEQGSQVDLTASARDVLQTAIGDEPTMEARRLMLEQILLQDPPKWLPFLGGLEGDMPFSEDGIPSSTRGLLRQVGLLDPSPRTKWLWRSVLSSVDSDEDSRTRTGDAAENLIVEFERRRLAAEGFPELAGRVRQVSCISNSYGYDVQTYAGRLYGGDPARGFAVEVKAMTKPARGRFRFYLTSHEWATFSQCSPNYAIYLVDGIGTQGTTSPGVAPWVIHDFRKLEQYLPGANACLSSGCFWVVCQVTMPLEQLERCPAR